MSNELIDAAGHDALVAAVEAAEEASGAEIVPMVVEACDGYSEADWAGAALGALAGGLATLLLPFVGGWRPQPVWLPGTLVALCALLGVLSTRIPAIRRGLVGAARLDERVDAAAHVAFVRHQVFRTRDRTGILLFVARFERQVRVLADEGVYQAVERAQWDELAAQVAAGMRDRAPAEALLDAVRRTGELVSRFGPRRRDDDRNELPDDPVTSV